MNKKHIIALLKRCTELPLYAFLIPMAGKKYIEIDNIYDPKKIIWKSSIEQCSDELLTEMADAICENDTNKNED